MAYHTSTTSRAVSNWLLIVAALVVGMSVAAATPSKPFAGRRQASKAVNEPHT